MKKALLVFAALACSSIFLKAQTKSNVAGYREVHLTDTSRRYRANTNSNDPLYFRPLDLDI